MIPDPINLQIGRKIYIARVLRGISTEIIAKELSVSEKKIDQYEKGFLDINMVELKAIADLLELPLSYFFTELKAL